MSRMLRRSIALAVVVVFASANIAFAAVTWGTRVALPGNYAWNYSNSLDYTGTPGTTNFKLHEAFVSDASLPEAIKYTSSKNGTTWSAAKKVSGSQHAEGSSLAAAGNTVIVGWFTGYSYYDAAGAARQTQVNISTNAGGTWSGVQKLSSAKGKVDYPIVAAAQTSARSDERVRGVDQLQDRRGRLPSVQQRWRPGRLPWSSERRRRRSRVPATASPAFANISAVRDLITVAWIADDTGTLKVRGINLNGNAAAATTIGNWSATATLADKISVAQNGFPIASASPQNTGVVTVAYNTDTAQKFVTYNGTAVSAPKTVFTNVGHVPGRVLDRGRARAAWWVRRDVGRLSGRRDHDPCNYGSAKAKFDLLAATSPTGTTLAHRRGGRFDHQGHAQRRAVVGRHPRYARE